MTNPPRRRLWIALVAVAVISAIALAIVLVSGGGEQSKRTAPPLATTPHPRPPPAAPSTTAPTPPPPGPPPAGPPPAGPPARPAPSHEQIGINVNRLFDGEPYAPDQMEALLAALQRTGVTVARSDALWEATEPAPPSGGIHDYDWSFDDLVARSLARHDLQWLPILDYSPSWAQSVPGQEHSPPSNSADFAAWAAAVASRYGAGGTFWQAHPELTPKPVDTFEVWNEPDNTEFWVPKPDPSEYASLYLAARDAIAAVDPSARVVLGGFSYSPATFVRAMLRARPDLPGHVDGVAIHPYGATPLVVLARVLGARRALDALHMGAVPLYVTEVGWVTNPPGSLDFIPASTRPGYIAALMAALGHTDCEIAAAILYTWVTPERDPANHEDWFGIQPPSGAPSPDVAAFTSGVAKARAAGRTLPVCAGPTRTQARSTRTARRAARR